MIQRIQSIYLFLAALSASIMFAFPLAKFYGSSNFALYVYRIDFYDPNPSLQFNSLFLLPLMCVIVFIVLLSIFTIISFKNRRRQLMLNRVNMVFTLVLLAGYFLGYMGMLENRVGNAPEYQFTSFMPIIVFVLLFLANRGIQKDEKLIRSMDRLR